LLIDTPPVGFLSDASLLIAMVDVAGVLCSGREESIPADPARLDAVGRDRILRWC
jgi:hypothetical protein